MVIMQQPPEITVAYLFTEHLASGPRLMEMILERGNMFKALARVRGNKGAPGVDKMTLDQLPAYLNPTTQLMETDQVFAFAFFGVKDRLGGFWPGSTRSAQARSQRSAASWAE